MRVHWGLQKTHLLLHRPRSSPAALPPAPSLFSCSFALQQRSSSPYWPARPAALCLSHGGASLAVDDIQGRPPGRFLILGLGLPRHVAVEALFVVARHRCPSAAFSAFSGSWPCGFHLPSWLLRPSAADRPLEPKRLNFQARSSRCDEEAGTGGGASQKRAKRIQRRRARLQLVSFRSPRGSRYPQQRWRLCF
eukprot:339458-Pyramimonas_sp.AAC.2